MEFLNTRNRCFTKSVYKGCIVKQYLKNQLRITMFAFIIVQIYVVHKVVHRSVSKDTFMSYNPAAEYTQSVLSTFQFKKIFRSKEN